MAGIIPFRNWRRRGRGGGDDGWGDVRTMIWAGALLGLAYFNVAAWTAPALVAAEDPFAAVTAPDPWAESRKSAEILLAQEGAPPVERAQASPTRGTPAADLASLRVVDGDTFRLGGETIRIADIDTP